MKRSRLRYPLFTGAVLAALALPVQAQRDGPQQQAPPPAQKPAAAPDTSAPSANPSPATTAQPGSGAAPATADAAKIEVPSGTHLPLVLHNAISTRNAKPGDPVYLETLFPIMIQGKIVIPAGSYVGGEVSESKRPGRVRGRGELLIRLNTIILPNGYLVNLNASPSNAGTGGNETTNNEGKVIGDSSKGTDVGTVAKTTAAGAGIGAIAGRSGEGAGIGAGIGAAAGLMAVLLSRGPEAEMPRGTTVEAVLNRPVLLDADKCNFTSPGQASTLPGPGNREQRNRIPF
jgi:hypothetical protein